MTEKKTPFVKRPPGRPRIKTPEQTKERQRVLWKARSRALSILSQRHHEEFVALKNDLLVLSGYDPIDSEFDRNPTRVTEDAKIDEEASGE